MRSPSITSFLVATLVALGGSAQEIFQLPANTKSRVSSFENLNGTPAQGGKTNKTAKGNAFEMLAPGQTKSLLDIGGAGIVSRIWLTVNRSPAMLRSLRLRMYWDNEKKPAVDVPMGDFFGHNLGKDVVFDSELFSSAEGRSFICYVPMPFRKHARIDLTNEGTQNCMLFFDVDFLLKTVPADALYFHAYWSRQRSSRLGEDYPLLPAIAGRGRFLGVSVGLNADSIYGHTWWGEGEVKMYIDGDSAYPTINGTGSEDYVGSAWGLGRFVNRYQGCTIADDSTHQYNFYRWHVPDPVYFNRRIRVDLQQIGGGTAKEVQELYKKGVALQPVTLARDDGFLRLFEMTNPPSLADEKFPDGWVNFYRIDDYSAVTYFYLNTPASSLPALAPVAERVANLR